MKSASLLVDSISRGRGDALVSHSLNDCDLGQFMKDCFGEIRRPFVNGKTVFCMSLLTKKRQRHIAVQLCSA